MNQLPSSSGAVVVAVSDRPEGGAALQWARRRAEAAGRPVIVVPITGDSPGTPVHVSQGLRGQIHEALTGTTADYTVLETTDDISETIVNLSTDADVAVLGVRRRSAARKFLLGSITQRVISEAGCPVVCVKA